MGEILGQVVDALHGMWRKRWIGLAVAWIAATAGLVAISRFQDKYEATARVYVDTKTVLRPLLRDLTVEPDLTQTLGLLTQTLITRPNIERLIGIVDLGAAQMTTEQRDALIERLIRKDIRISGSGRESVFAFNYRHTDPEKARAIVQALVSMFVESDLGSKRRDAEDARAFIDEQIRNYEARLAEAEGRLKDFKIRNLGMSDPGGKDYFARISMLTEESGKLSLELRAAEQSRDALKRELDGERMQLVPDDPIVATEAPPNPDIEGRLDAQRKLLDDLLRRYTDLHPDVIATRRLLDRLEEQKQQYQENWRKSAAAKQAIAKRTPVVDPTTQQVKLALAEAEASVASLKVRVAEAQSKLGQLRAAASKVPQIEAEYAQLNRDYSVIRGNYEALVARREKASLSEDVDSTRVAQFRVIDPPRSAQDPVFPNRAALAPAALVAGLVAGLLASLAVSQFVPVVTSVKQLRELAGRTVLGSISAQPTIELVRSRRRSNLSFGGGLAALVGAYGLCMYLLTHTIRI